MWVPLLLVGAVAAWAVSRPSQQAGAKNVKAKR